MRESGLGPRDFCGTPSFDATFDGIRRWRGLPFARSEELTEAVDDDVDVLLHESELLESSVSQPSSEEPDELDDELLEPPHPSELDELLESSESQPEESSLLESSESQPSLPLDELDELDELPPHESELLP